MVATLRSGRTWRVTPGQTLHCREWDDEVVLYNDLSGSTHLLDGAALDLLQTLQGRSADAATLAADLADRFDADGADLPTLIDDMLATLGQLDLVEPC
jgi:PqqD family protein of HPr-rel-A system